MIFFYLSIVLLAYVLYRWVYLPMVYWKKRGIPYETPLPFVGALGPILIRKVTFLDQFDQLYQRNKHQRCVGIHQMLTPTLLINDPEMIKLITVKYFDHFMDHRDMGDSVETFFSKNLFALKGHEWKEMRNLLSPAFTGRKMKMMFGLMSECAQKFSDHYEKEARKQGILELDVKDIFRKYTNDVIASCAYGLECDSINDPRNEFFKMGEATTNMSGFLQTFKMLMANFAPSLLKLFKLRVFPKEVSDFFLNVITQTIDYRTEKQVVRPDMIQLLLDARKGKLRFEEEEDKTVDAGFAVVEESDFGKSGVSNPGKYLSNEDITAQAFIFFFAGFENVASQLSLVATELAIHPEAQEKLFKEVETVMKQSNGKPTYETVIRMKYLDMVISESFRKWPQGVMVDRKCNKEFIIQPKNDSEKPITLNPGDLVVFSVVGIHRDPQYYPNPMKFDPERFSDENKDNIQPYTYLPFGIGPRACIASRFAIMEVKILITYLVYKFQFEVVQKTSVPITLSPSKLFIEPKDGFWLGFKPRNL